jgi:hypothetical protein
VNKNITRKEFLRNTSKYAAGVAVGTGALSMIAGKPLFAGTKTDWPWPYTALDVEAIRIAAHDAYYAGFGCGYGAFEAIINALRTAVGDPYNSLPGQLMGYAAGGAVGWGTLCGALNGAAAVISLVAPSADSSALVNELLGWYTQTLFPTDISNQYAEDHTFTVNNYDQALPQNVSGSALCHISVTGWCNAADFDSGSTERKERCARLTGDVAAYAVKILNDHFAGTFTALYVPPASISACNTCHGGSGTVKNVASKMDCVQCHGEDPHPSSVEHIGEPISTYKLSQNFPNPFNPSTKIRFSIPRLENVNLNIYDVHGRLIRTIVNNTSYNAGTYDVNWDGRNDWGELVSSGIYFSKITAGKFTETKKMSLVK